METSNIGVSSQASFVVGGVQPINNARGRGCRQNAETATESWSKKFALVNTSQFDSDPNEVDHWTPESSWCAGCWHWTVDCEHLLDPLPLPHHAVEDACVESLAYDRATQCLEVRYKWNSIHQYHPCRQRAKSGEPARCTWPSMHC
jgi:hypothetical protein